MLARYMYARSNRPVRYAAPGVAQWLQLQARLAGLLGHRTPGSPASDYLGTLSLPHLGLEGAGDPLEGELFRAMLGGHEGAAGMYNDYAQDRGMRDGDLLEIARNLAAGERRGRHLTPAQMSHRGIGREYRRPNLLTGQSAQDAVQQLLRLLGQTAVGGRLPAQARRSFQDRLGLADAAAPGGSLMALIQGLDAADEMSQLPAYGVHTPGVLREAVGSAVNRLGVALEDSPHGQGYEASENEPR